MDPSDSLPVAFDALARFFVGEESLQGTLQQVLDLAHETIVPADMVGITMLNADGKPVTAVFTSGEAPEIDQAQYRTGAGPCLQAFRTGEVVRIEDTATDERWPGLGRHDSCRHRRAVLAHLGRFGYDATAQVPGPAPAVVDTSDPFDPFDFSAAEPPATPSILSAA